MRTRLNNFLISGLLLFSPALYGQQFQLTQYQEALPLYNPAFSAIENYTDFRFGLRKQWVGFSDSPFTTYAHASGVLPDFTKKRRKVRYKSPYDIEKLTDMVEFPDNALRMSNPYLYRRIIRDSVRLAVRRLDAKERLRLRRQLRTTSNLEHQPKHGYSATLITDQQGAFTTFSMNLGYAVHLPVTNRFMLAAGASGLLTNTRFDKSKAQVLDETNDLLYQRYLAGEVNSNALLLNTGLVLYSSNFHMGYAITKIASSGLGSELTFGESAMDTRHNLMSALQIQVHPDVSVAPGLLFSYRHRTPFILQLNTRVYYREKVWLGINYRNKDAIGGALGFFFNDIYKLSYAWDVSTSALSRTTGGTHEVIFGILLSRGASPNPIIR